MNIDDLFPSKYVKASDLAGAALTLHIASVRTDLMNDGTPKAVLYFTNGKPLVLNVTNKNCIKSLYGADTTAWQGKPIQLVATTTEFAGKVVDCIRLRPPPLPQAAQLTAVGPQQPQQGNAGVPAHVTAPSGEPEQTGEPVFDDDNVPL
jgi:hypothetical protein